MRRQVEAIRSRGRAVLVRAVALHLASWEGASRRAQRLLSALRRACRELGIEPWTLRVVLPRLPHDVGARECLELAESLSRLEALVALPMDAQHPCVAHLGALLKRTRVFIGIASSSASEMESVLGELRRLRLGLEHYVRVAVVAGDPPETPYLPATQSTRDGISVALRYAPDAARAVREGSLKPLASEVVRVERIARSLASKVGLDYLGVDLSLSPWMDESVARVIELLQGAPLGSPGTMWAVGRVNAMIRELAEEAGVEAIGYGEVMLSVLEDSLLSARVGEKRVRLRDLVSYSAACAVGVDMVAVPPTLDLRGLARDVWVVRGLKSGPVSVRLLFSEALPGSAVYVEGFGATFVIEP